MAPSKGNDDNNSKNNKNKQTVINENNEKIEECINNIINASNNKEDLKNINEIYNIVYNSIFTSISLNDFMALSIDNLISSLQNYILTFQDNLNIESMELIEKIMFMCFFHFHLKIINLGFSILKFLLEITDYSYHEQLLTNMIKIIQILNLKRNIGKSNNSISSVIISNLSLSLYFILNYENPNQNTKKIFYDFILKNLNETNLIYLLTISCSNENNFSKSLNTDMIRDILDKFKTELNKNFNQLNNFISKNDNSLSSKSICQQTFDKIGCICKIIDSFIIKGHRTYNVDKIIKNLIPISRKILNLLITKIDNENLVLSLETISNIINFTNSIDSFDNEYILKTLNWNQKLLQNNIEYLMNTYQIIEILSILTIKSQGNNKNKENICLVIIQIIENILSMNDVIIDIYVPFYLIKIKKCVDNIQNSDYIIDKNKFPKAFNFFNDECNLNEIKYDIENFNYYIREYIKSIKESNGEDKNYDINFIKNCILKFEEFKNSIKQIYNLNDSKDTDNRIENFKKKLASNKLKNEEFETFFIETSIEMFKELFQ
jgi:hypothetical protein